MKRINWNCAYMSRWNSKEPIHIFILFRLLRMSKLLRSLIQLIDVLLLVLCVCLILCLKYHILIGLLRWGLLVQAGISWSHLSHVNRDVFFGYLLLPLEVPETIDVSLSHLLLGTKLAILHLLLFELVICLLEQTTLLVNLKFIWVHIRRNRDLIINLIWWLRLR